MLKWILSSFYFFLPAYLTNMTPSLMASKGFFKCLDKPLDFGRKFQGSPILGNHKTWRGILLGLTTGLLIALFQRQLFNGSLFIREISFLNYQAINIFFFGFLMSGGALCGDLFFAFIKRRLGLKPGTRFLPFDQINYVIGSALFLSPFYTINMGVWITLLILTFILHISATQIGFRLGLSQNQW